jgi:hypothetical protein
MFKIAAFTCHEYMYSHKLQEQVCSLFCDKMNLKAMNRLCERLEVMMVKTGVIHNHRLSVNVQ